jgi:CBS domain-containing protein
VDSAGQLAGLVTLNRIRQVPKEQRAATRLADIGCRPADLPVAAAHEPLTDLLLRMAGCSDGRAVVLDPQRRLVGIVSPSDVARTVQAAELRMPVGDRA